MLKFNITRFNSWRFNTEILQIQILTNALPFQESEYESNSNKVDCFDLVRG